MIAESGKTAKALIPLRLKKVYFNELSWVWFLFVPSVVY